MWFLDQDCWAGLYFKINDRRWWSAIQGALPWVIASVKITSEPGFAAGTVTTSASVCASRISGGRGQLALWLPGTQHNPPSPGPVSLSCQEMTVNPLYIRPLR